MKIGWVFLWLNYLTKTNLNLLNYLIGLRYNMEKRYCSVPHNPPHTYGDCIRACLATLIDDDKFPHFFNGITETEEVWGKIRNYLKGKGNLLILFSISDVKEFSEVNPDLTFMVMGITQNHLLHAVLCKDNKVVHDPARITKTFTDIKPIEQGEWIIGIIK
jgi:hypothetical protein